MKQIVHIRHLHDLETFAEHFSLSLKGGDIVGLVGDLGSGKTTFIQHLAKAYGVKKPVRSPTFILMQVFQTGAKAAKKTGVVQLCHIDAYRLEDEDELFALGFEDYASRRDTVVLIEWVDRVPSVQWLDHYREVKFEFGGDGERILTLDKPLASAAD